MSFQQILDTDEEAFHLCETTCPLQRTKKTEIGSTVELKLAWAENAVQCFSHTLVIQSFWSFGNGSALT